MNKNEETRHLNGCSEAMMGATTGEANLGAMSPQTHLETHPKIRVFELATSEFHIKQVTIVT